MAKRFFYFFIGLTIGIVFIYFVLMRGKDFDFWMPGERVKTELTARTLNFTEKANCQLTCVGLNPDSLQGVINSSKVNFKKSKVHEKPCKVYILELSETTTEMEFSVCDTIVTLNSFVQPGKDCACN